MAMHLILRLNANAMKKKLNAMMKFTYIMDSIGNNSHIGSKEPGLSLDQHLHKNSNSRKVLSYSRIIDNDIKQVL